MNAEDLKNYILDLQPVIEFKTTYDNIKKKFAAENSSDIKLLSEIKLDLKDAIT